LLMRIEILVENQEPQIFSLKKAKMLIGSHESCDIVLPANGISRKHLLIVNNEDNFFVIDQGSTNGSYINEQRLVPGKSADFTSFFPVRLGDTVLITLLSDEEKSPLLSEPLLSDQTVSKPIDSKSSADQSDSSTKMVSLKDLQGSKATQKLVKKRVEVRAKKKVTPAVLSEAAIKDKQRMTMAKIIGVSVIAIAVYFNVKTQETEPPQEVGVSVQVPASVVKEQVKAEEPKIIKLNQSDLIPKDSFKILINDIKCVNDYEKYLCNKIPGVGDERWGVVQVGTMLNVFIDATPYFQRAQEMVREPLGIDGLPPKEEEVQQFHQDVMMTSTMIFMIDKMPRDLDIDLLKGKNVTLVFFLKRSEGDPTVFALAFRSESIKPFLESFTSSHLERAYKLGVKAFEQFQDYFYYY
jgi:pSer/pThr/pTyr-binding forkhead associated (FHA) protein